VRVAHDGPAALEAARIQRPQVVLLDIGLPGMDGYEVCRRIRQQGRSDARIIAVTGYGQERDRERSRDAGFDSHAVKPVDPSELMKLVSGI
jgi:CheY-like chemotaxis protein